MRASRSRETPLLEWFAAMMTAGLGSATGDRRSELQRPWIGAAGALLLLVLIVGCPQVGTVPQCPNQVQRQPLPVASLACANPSKLSALIQSANGDEALASARVRRHLTDRGYEGHVRSFPLQDDGLTGELLLLGPENIDDDGAPRPGAARWINVGASTPVTLLDSLRLALTAPTARSRAIMVVLARTLEPESGSPNLQRFKELADCRSQIPQLSDAAAPLQAAVLVYEFIRPPSAAMRPTNAGERVTQPDLLTARLDLGDCP